MVVVNEIRSTLNFESEILQKPAEQSFDEEEITAGISPVILDFLKDKGYYLVDVLGQGCTRKTFLARYVSGEVNKLRVVKVPLEKFDKNSICTIINKSKNRDMDANEANISNKLAHPHLIDVLDNFKVAGMNINVESYFNAKNLEEIVKKEGPIKDENKFYKLFSQVVDAVYYANVEESCFIRDIKPSNTLVNNKDFVRLTDLQNATKRWSSQPSTLPTRGGTPYTHPKLLNALFSKWAENADGRTESYSVAATMYYALTGEKPFDYKVEIVKQGEGHKITVDDKDYYIRLLIDGKEAKNIDVENHEIRLKKALKKVPRKYRKMLYKSLTMNDGNNSWSYTIGHVESDFKKFEKPSLNKFARQIYNSIKPALMVGVGVLIGGAFVNLAIYQNNNTEPRPTLSEILRNEDYKEFSLQEPAMIDPVLKIGTKANIEYNYLWDILNNQITDVEEGLDELNRGKLVMDKEDLDLYTRLGSDVHWMDKRLTSSLLRSCLMADKEDVEKLYNNKRHSPTFVPEDFIVRNYNHGEFSTPVSNTPTSTMIAFGVRYLKSCMSHDKNVADVFASYFCSDVEIRSAMINTGSSTYFPTITDDNSITTGYSFLLHPKKRELIERAILLYTLTDEEGNVHMDKLPKLNFFEGEYENRLLNTDLSLIKK
ncbi:MAG: hypothetical protein KJ583_03355 [Nanoarchaeota archaeon]|nr:hypothetical protein [Nanoarchaeota archaeon]MBU1270334.1 hypothetical protein [Nanoarchaeota archaeon]MBU1604331.1 hypothetical protein [Nanoarchaeota archaeon]MBU2443574.1 hypothetical protein [Nanoarchaeota archaeon]